MDGSGNGYLKAVGDYVHLNPSRAGLLAPEQPLSSFPWSSYPRYLAEPGQRPVWLRVDRLLGEWGIPKDSEAGRRAFEERMEWRRQCEQEGEFMVEIARELRSQTTMPLAWIAQRLWMGTRGHLAWLLQQKPRNIESPSDQGFLRL